MHERKAITNELASRYQKATKLERSRLLSEFVALTGYTRSYASFVLHHWGGRQIKCVNGQRVEVRIGLRTDADRLKAKLQRRPRTRIYDQDTLTCLEKLWAISDGICGKRLAAFIKLSLPALERFREFTFPEGEAGSRQREKLLALSPATIDRLLAPARRKLLGQERSQTKPGTLLKHHIPVRTFSDWNEQTPGFLEIDLVAHDGGSGYGDFIQSLNAVDIVTCWTETWPARNKAQYHVFGALQVIRGELPFPLLGIDSDNGGEFINNELLRYCEREQITFTRSRPLRKNDNCFVEQKNYTIVRRICGYYRYDNDTQFHLLQELYRSVRLYTNFFLPVVKLQAKTRIGSRVHKVYDTPRTPLERLLGHPSIPKERKEELADQFHRLNPAELKRTIGLLQQKLFAMASPLPQRPVKFIPYPGQNHPWRKSDPRRTNLLAAALDSAQGKPDTRPSPPRAKKHTEITTTSS